MFLFLDFGGIWAGVVIRERVQEMTPLALKWSEIQVSMSWDAGWGKAQTLHSGILKKNK